MHTEPKPVQPQKPPLLSELPEPVAEELENVTIRVVRFDQLGPQAARTLPRTASSGERPTTRSRAARHAERSCYEPHSCAGSTTHGTRASRTRSHGASAR